MKNYIDADRLRANIDALIAGTPSDWIGAPAAIAAYKDVLNSIELLQQEQPGVDLDEKTMNIEINKVLDKNGWYHPDLKDRVIINSIARHFYGLRNRALEKAARHVYESWMGGTMDDVRRDMVKLGKVLNARKEASK